MYHKIVLIEPAICGLCLCPNSTKIDERLICYCSIKAYGIIWTKIAYSRISDNPNIIPEYAGLFSNRIIIEMFTKPTVLLNKQ